LAHGVFLRSGRERGRAGGVHARGRALPRSEQPRVSLLVVQRRSDPERQARGRRRHAHGARLGVPRARPSLCALRPAMSAQATRFLPRRELGRTGFVATLLGAGDLADRSVPLDTCVATLRRALDAGLNVVDTAPVYENGYSEEIVGRAVEGRRDGLFLIDKIDHFDRPVAPQLEESLGRLRTQVDLFVFHGVSSLEAWQKLASPGGAFDELGALVRAGKARFRGISCHHPEVLLAAIPSGLCDVV